MAQYLSNQRPQQLNNTFAVPPAIGNTTPNSGTFTTLSAQQIKLSIKTINSNYAIASNDSVLLCDATSDQFQITLPNPATCSGRVINIKKIDSTANRVVLTALYGAIDTQETYQLKYAMESIVVISNGSNYFVI